MTTREMMKVSTYKFSWFIESDGDKHGEWHYCLVLAKDPKDAVAKFSYVHPTVAKFSIEPFDTEVIK